MTKKPVHKTLKFYPHLVDLILSGKKTCTWRLWDDKDIQVGDEIIFLKSFELVPFAKANIISVVEKTLGTISDEDREGHEGFESEEKMYESYANYYKREVTPQTLVKVVKFKLI